MALPVAHWAVALGITRSTDRLVWFLLAGLAVLPDCDFILVWGFGLERISYHRTFSHSLVFFALLALLWGCVRPLRFRRASAGLCFLVLFSHSFLDMLCTVDVIDHGVMLFWPFADHRLGWPILVPLYRFFGETPFSPQGAFRFTLLELLLAGPLWICGRKLGDGAKACRSYLLRRFPFGTGFLLEGEPQGTATAECPGKNGSSLPTSPPFPPDPSV